MSWPLRLSLVALLLRFLVLFPLPEAQESRRGTLHHADPTPHYFIGYICPNLFAGSTQMSGRCMDHVHDWFPLLASISRLLPFPEVSRAILRTPTQHARRLALFI